ncbi:MAG: sporulation protein [Saprospiraceae bacterium]
MIGKVKNWLGIEGVKLELDIPETAVQEVGTVVGKIKFYSMRPQTVRSIKVALVERYARGRGEEKLTDEYQLGVIEIDKNIEVPADEIVEVKFALPFQIVKSEMEEFGDKNLIFKGLSKVARKINAVKSTYRIEAEADIKGVALNPFDKREIEVM